MVRSETAIRGVAGEPCNPVESAFGIYTCCSTPIVGVVENDAFLVEVRKAHKYVAF